MIIKWYWPKYPKIDGYTCWGRRSACRIFSIITLQAVGVTFPWMITQKMHVKACNYVRTNHSAVLLIWNLLRYILCCDWSSNNLNQSAGRHSSEPRTFCIFLVITLGKVTPTAWKVNVKKFWQVQNKVGFCRGASEQNIISCLKWSKWAQKGPKC